MNTQQKLQNAEKLVKELKAQLEKEEQEAKNKPIIFKNKEFRIIEWTKPIKDFVYPKGFRMAEFQEFVDLVDSGYKMELWIDYFTKHWSKLQQAKEYCLSRCFLSEYSGLYAYNSYLANSNDNGRVVCVRDLK